MCTFLHGLYWIMKKNYTKIKDFQWKICSKKVGLLTENQRVSHGENILWTKRLITFELVLKYMPLNTLYTKNHTQCW